MNPHEVYKLVLTGGPCAGKSTAIARVRALLEAEGYAVAVVPEAARLLFGSGFGRQSSRHPADEAVRQWLMAKTQCALEDAMIGDLALGDRPGVVVCDRGVHDNRPYMTNEVYARYRAMMGRKLDFTRYDAVIHLQSAAVGSPDDYVQDDIRLETAQRAAGLDAQTREAWNDHPRLVIVESVPDFEAKMRRLEAVISALLPPRPGFAIYPQET